MYLSVSVPPCLREKHEIEICAKRPMNAETDYRILEIRGMIPPSSRTASPLAGKVTNKTEVP